MAPRNLRNPVVGPSFLDSWLAMNLMAESLAAIWVDYHIFSHPFAGLALSRCWRWHKWKCHQQPLKRRWWWFTKRSSSVNEAACVDVSSTIVWRMRDLPRSIGVERLHCNQQVLRCLLSCEHCSPARGLFPVLQAHDAKGSVFIFAQSSNCEDRVRCRGEVWMLHRV